MQRMTIVGHHLQAEKPPADGLPALQAMPPRDGTIGTRFIGKPIRVDAWCIEAVQGYAKQYGRTCAAALDLEIHVLRTERDALKARLDELQQP